jgi:acetate kinase
MILVLNCGSQSIKWKLFEEKNLKLNKEGKRSILKAKDYQVSLEEELKKIKNLKENISKIGHRVVHGGKDFRKPTIITEDILKKLEKLNKLAPIHNPFNVLGIKTSQKIFPEASQIAVFDTQFYTELPEKAYTYALPENLREKFGFRKFGFHGISHEFVSREGAELVKKHFKKLKIISCHLGGGASITAIKNGRVIDTSMGYTPLDGPIMMTRSGNVDPGVVLEICRFFSAEKANEILNSESGLKGICGAKEMLEVLRKIRKGDKKAKLALEIFVYSIQKYIGAYYAILGGCDLLVFTGTIGFESRKIRNMICQRLNFLKKTNVLAIKTNEELAIARKIKSENKL